jgi:hypothetical protein
MPGGAWLLNASSNPVSTAAISACVAAEPPANSSAITVARALFATAGQ